MPCHWFSSCLLLVPISQKEQQRGLLPWILDVRLVTLFKAEIVHKYAAVFSISVFIFFILNITSYQFNFSLLLTLPLSHLLAFSKVSPSAGLISEQSRNGFVHNSNVHHIMSCMLLQLLGVLKLKTTRFVLIMLTFGVGWCSSYCITGSWAK